MENEANPPTAEELVSNKSQENFSQEPKKFFLTRWIKDNYDKAFLVILIAAFAIRFWIFTQTLNQPIWWDAGDYLSAAKKWGLGLNIEDIWYYRRGFLWPLFSAFFYATGIGEVGIRFSEVLFSTGIVFVSYFLIKRTFNKKIALLTSLGVSMSWVYLFFTGRPLTSIPSTFFMLTALLFFWEGYVQKHNMKKMVLFIVFFFLAVMTRFQMMMFAFPILILVFTKEKFKALKNKNLWILVLIFLVLLIPYFYLYYQNYGNPVTDIMGHYFGVGEGEVKPSGEKSDTFLYYFKDMPYILTGKYQLLTPLVIMFIFGMLLYFSDLILGFDKIFKNPKLRNRLFVLSWWVIPFIILGWITAVVEQRYTMSVIPFLFAIISFGLLKVRALLNLKISKEKYFIIIFILLLFLLIPNYNFGKNMIESKKNSYAEVRDAGIWIKQNSDPNDKIITSSEPQITYYSERSTFGFGETKEEFENKLREMDIRFVILSAFEFHHPWAYSYPQEHPNILAPIKVYGPQDQPILIVYAVNSQALINPPANNSEPLEEIILEEPPTINELQ